MRPDAFSWTIVPDRFYGRLCPQTDSFRSNLFQVGQQHILQSQLGVISPAFQFYPKEWLSSANVNLMTPAQEGAYFRLLAYAWLDPDCSIPDDDAQLAMLSRLGEGWLKGGSALVRKCFQPHPTIPGRLINKRLLQEREKQRVWREKSREGGLRSAASRGKTKGRVVGKWLEPNVNQMPTLQSPVSCLQSPYVQKDHTSKESDGNGDFPEVIRVFHPDSRIVLAWLNEKAGVHFREIDVNLGPISDRLAEEGITLEGIKTMLERQILCWQGTNMGDYLRPSTLFSKKKFDGYYAIRLQPIHFNNKPTPKPQDSIIMQDLKRAARQAMQ